jgi:hypothetical protein
MAQIRTSNPTADMASMLAKARGYPDWRLADVLSGKDLSIPQYAAMAEAMGRKDLRQAMDGQQAQQEAQQPSIKEQLLAEQKAPQVAAGIDQLAAPNMEPIGLAGGGIIAFNGENGSQVPTQEEIDEYIANNPALQRIQKITNPGKAISDWASSLPSQQEIWERGRKARTGELKTFTNEQTPKGKLVEAGLADSDTPRRDLLKVATEREAERNLALNPQMSKIDWNKVDQAKKQQNENKDDRSDKTDSAGNNAATDTTTSAFGLSPRVSRLSGLKTDEVDYNRLKEQGFGEGLMKMAAGVLSKPTLAGGLGAGIGALAESGALTRKEIAGLKKDKREYDFLMAKAEDAFDMGNDKLAFEYKKAADEHKARMAQIGVMGGSSPLALINAIKKENPGMSILDVLGAQAGLKQDPRTDQALKAKHADYMESTAVKYGLVKPLTYPEWLAANGYTTAGQQVAASGNQGYSRGVFDINGRQIQ